MRIKFLGVPPFALTLIVWLALPSFGTTANLNGVGATKSAFTSAHGLSLGGCPAKTCFGPPTATGAGHPYQFELVQFGDGNRVIGYTEAFPKETSLATAEHDALAEFPGDTVVGKTGVITNDSSGQACRWLDVTSSTLGKLFANPKTSAALQKLLGPPSRLSVEFATTDSAGNWTYSPTNINQALVAPGWYQSGNGC
jgi:hypothetical protein